MFLLNRTFFIKTPFLDDLQGYLFASHQNYTFGNVVDTRLGTAHEGAMYMYQEYLMSMEVFWVVCAAIPVATWLFLA